MAYTFRKAIREEVGLLVGLIGASGSGKSFSAMRLASGMCAPGERFAVIDTEKRRALHYADRFDFDHAQMNEPFRPDAYADAIASAAKAGYKVIVVDSMSHEWSGVGGVLEYQEEELQRMAGDDWKKRESCKMAAWIKPKSAHKHMIQRLLQVNAHLILCFRAEEKVKMEKDAQNKTVIVPIGWQPICSKELPYELTVSMLLTPENPGIPQFLKLQEQHKHLFPAGSLIDESAGKAVSLWAKGGSVSLTCTDCQKEIVDADIKGRVYSASNIAKISQKRFGVDLCAICTEARQRAGSEASQTTDVQEDHQSNIPEMISEIETVFAERNMGDLARVKFIKDAVGKAETLTKLSDEEIRKVWEAVNK